MPETFEQHFAKKKEKESPQKKHPLYIEKKLQKITEESSLILEKIKQITGGKDLRETPEEELSQLPLDAISLEELQRLKELLEKKKKIEKGEYYKKEIIGWKLEGISTKENVLTEYQARGEIWVANFSPKGDKVVIGNNNGMIRIIGKKK